MAVYVLDCFFEICELTGIVAICSVNIALPHLEVNVISVMLVCAFGIKNIPKRSINMPTRLFIWVAIRFLSLLDFL